MWRYEWKKIICQDQGNLTNAQVMIVIFSFLRIHMLLTPLWLVTMWKYLLNPSLSVDSILLIGKPLLEPAID